MPELELRVVPRGPDLPRFQRAVDFVRNASEVRARLGPRHRLLALEFVEDQQKPLPAPSAERFRATFYDYTENQALLVHGSLGAPDLVEVGEPALQPRPNSDEFEEAVAILRDDPRFAQPIAEGRLLAYRAMPPLVQGATERTLAVGLLPAEGEKGHEIVAVNMVDRSVLRFDDKAPPTSVAHNPICGLPGLYQPTTPRGVPGQADVTVLRGGSVVWSFTVVRPAASSGIEGSAVELRSVSYRGTRVLHQAHVPILNVLYDGNVCGPYRDWQWEEGAFSADGVDIAPGIRSCTAPATTILDTGRDHGDFRGVAIYADGPEVVLVSELEAGWYRYISEWRLHEDGTIKPRFGFSAVKNSCVCTTHHHHVYWRLDFDIASGAQNRVVELTESGGVPQPHLVEVRRHRDPAQPRRWRVEDALTNSGYTIVPGPDDGVADGYGRGDVWILRYRATEIDDGPWWTTGRTEADLDKYVNGEVVESADVVFWYAAHFTHHGGADEGHGHRVGPDLVPRNWTPQV